MNITEEIKEYVNTQKARAERQEILLKKDASVLYYRIKVLEDIINNNNQKELYVAKKYLIDSQFESEVISIRDCVENHEKSVLKKYL
jgi:hypothetical protein